MTGVRVWLIGLANGRPTPLDESWLVEYDPTRPGVGPRGEPMNAHIVTTTDPAKARVFPDHGAAHAYWTRDSGRARPDGEPDRPLTAYMLLTSPVSTGADAL